MSTAPIERERAYPLADALLTTTILDLIHAASDNRQVRLGANQANQALNRGIAELIVMAADATPLEVVLHLPIICEEKNVGYVFVPSKEAIGKAVNSNRKIIAVAITSNDASLLNKRIQELKGKIEEIII
jgi:U4/U6 small nuclear ribonucleoprotein SNU13